MANVRRIIPAVICVVCGGLSLWVSLYLTRFQSTDKIPGDFFPRWYGARELILHGRNPYSQAVTAEIQKIAYEHFPATAHRDEHRFAYPIYAVVFAIPTMWLPFPDVIVVMQVVLAVAAAASMVCWMNAMRWQTSIATKAAVILLTMSSMGVVQGIRLQQFSLLVSFLIALCVLFITRNGLTSAGIVLALSTIKPQMVVVLVIWCFVWTFWRWKERKPLVISFATCMLVLVLAGEWLQPGWVTDFVTGLSAYSHYAEPQSLLIVAFGKAFGVALSVIVLAGVIMIVNARREDFVFVTALVLTATMLCSPALGTSVHGQVLILPAILLLARRFIESSANSSERGGLVGSRTTSA